MSDGEVDILRFFRTYKAGANEMLFLNSGFAKAHPPQFKRAMQALMDRGLVVQERPRDAYSLTASGYRARSAREAAQARRWARSTFHHRQHNSPIRAVSAETSFNAYHQWLGIPLAEQPPDHYRLLGIGLYEADPAVIEASADRQMTHLKTYTAGPRGVLSQQLLNEIAAAKVCLLSARHKSQYDDGLRKRRSTEQVIRRRPPPPAGMNGMSSIGVDRAIQGPLLIAARSDLPTAVPAAPPVAPPVVQQVGTQIAVQASGVVVPSEPETTQAFAALDRRPSTLRIKRGHAWSAVATVFLAMLLINIVLVGVWLISRQLHGDGADKIEPQAAVAKPIERTPLVVNEARAATGAAERRATSPTELATRDSTDEPTETVTLEISAAALAELPSDPAVPLRLYLDDLKEAEKVVGRGVLGRHGATGLSARKKEPAKFLFHGTAPAHAVCVHPPSVGSAYVAYELGGQFNMFTATAAIHDRARREPASAIQFKLFGDDQLLWTSSRLKLHGESEDCRVDITGVRRLKLQIDCTGGNKFALAAWVDPLVQ